MKAMLIKDWKLMKGQKQFIFILCIFLAVFGATSNNLGFLISYMTLMATIFSISTISYDDCIFISTSDQPQEICRGEILILFTDIFDSVSSVSDCYSGHWNCPVNQCNIRRSGDQCGSSPGNGCFDMWLYASNTTQIRIGEKSNCYGSNGSCNFCNRICHGVDW